MNFTPEQEAEIRSLAHQEAAKLLAELSRNLLGPESIKGGSLPAFDHNTDDKALSTRLNPSSASSGIMHQQTFVKVNARCDKGIAPLVIALNELYGVETLDSCQDDGLWGATVFFTFGDTWSTLATLLQELSDQLANLWPLSCEYSMRLEWLGSNNRPRAQISLPPQHIETLAAAIKELVPILNCHMSALVGDNDAQSLAIR